MIPEKDWRWQGHAGHFICSPRCLFHLNTLVGNYIISTVGDYRPDMEKSEKAEEIGCNRLFETYVFEGHHSCGCGCEARIPTEWCEIDSYCSNTAKKAREGHMEMCYKYAKMGGASNESEE